MGNGDTGTVKKRGRPRKNTLPREVDIVEVKPVAEKRKAGRPKGSKDKKKRVNKNGYTMSPVALEQRRRIHNTLPAKTEAEMAYNARLIEHIMRINEIAANADKSDLLSLKSCFIAYLRLCQEDGFNVGNMAAYASMGFSDTTHFNAYCRKDDPEIREFGKFVKQTCAMFREGLVADSKLNPVIGIFWQRNFDGLRNDTEQVQNPNAEDDDFTVAKGYKEKYKVLIGGGSE